MIKKYGVMPGLHNRGLTSAEEGESQAWRAGQSGDGCLPVVAGEDLVKIAWLGRRRLTGTSPGPPL